MPPVLTVTEASGYKVLAAASGDEALRMSEQHPGEIHLLLTDMVMPRISGKLLAQELAKAFVRDGVIEEGTHFIGKPLTASDLAYKVREVLGMSTTSVLAAPSKD
jgi:CheY-like chemotaxis protein